MSEKSLAQIQEEIANLKAMAAKLEAAQRQESIDKVKALMAELNVSMSDLSAGKRKSSSPPLAPKYRDPASGQSWSGRGRLPAWMSAALAAGKKREDFLIK